MALLDLWEPMQDLISLREAMDRLFEESFVRPGFARLRRVEGDRVYRLPVDVYSTPDEVVIKASVPGLSPDDLDITIEGDTLTIKGEIKPPTAEGDCLIQERFCGPFARTLTFNIPVQAEKAEAVFENGVLTLTIPKAEEIKPKVIKVKSKK